MKQHKCQKVVDMCCGTGRHTLFLAANGFDVYGFDSSRSGVDITASRAKELSLKVNLRVADIACSGFEDHIFDALLCVWSTGHGKKSQYFGSTISEMFRIVKLGGIVMFDIPSVNNRLYGKGTLIETDTFLHDSIGHSDVPHYYCNKDEVIKKVSKFSSEYTISEIEYEDEKYNEVIKAYWITAVNNRNQ
jgi:ubiquinone/menaquinone biosynthesis C-methylase UbiE